MVKKLTEETITEKHISKLVVVVVSISKRGNTNRDLPFTPCPFPCFSFSMLGPSQHGCTAL